VKAGTQLKTEVQEFKRLRILEEARELFFLQGYEATTLDRRAAQRHEAVPL
jgi:AcrR family transcriptional regulator